VLLIALATAPCHTGHAQEAAVRDAASIRPSRCVSGEMPDDPDIEGPVRPEAPDRIVVERCQGVSQLVVLDGVRAPVGLQCCRPVDGRYIDCADLLALWCSLRNDAHRLVSRALLDHRRVSCRMLRPERDGLAEPQPDDGAGGAGAG
jgi:hypothetical protein